MLAGKGLRLANSAARRVVFVALCCLLLVFSLTGFTLSAPVDLEPELAILAPVVQTYDLDAYRWDFPFALVGFGPGARTARLTELRIDGHDLLGTIPMAQRTMPVHRLDEEIAPAAFRSWNNYRQRASVLRVRNDERQALSTAEEREFREGNARMREVMRRRGEIAPLNIALNVSELPFRVAADGHYRVRAVVERGGRSAVWEGEVLIVDIEPVTTNSTWTPADLHLHSTFALDGIFTPGELASRLANRGYSIGYITDEPAGRYITTQPILPRMSGTGRRGTAIESGTNAWLTATFGNDRVRYLPYLATWEDYHARVRAASSAQIAMFPGVEIAASTANHTHTDHNGHALAYGIQNLVGIGGASGFEISGLRYSWFAPNTLLENINNNRLGWSSGGIAHPGAQPPLGYPWNIWSPTLFARYDGFELMSGALQTNFSPGFGPMQKWREEIVARLNATFAGNGFPSARTGSDWADVLSQFTSIPFVTHIGLSQWWGDMTQLGQENVDAALRAGRTVASRFGGLAILRLRDAQGVPQEIGSRFTMPVHATVSGEITLRAARTGFYRVRVIENRSTRTGLEDTRHDSWHTVSSGHSMGIIHRPGMPTWRGDGHTYSLVLLPCTQKGGAQRK